jgi:hypothetical protein
MHHVERTGFAAEQLTAKVLAVGEEAAKDSDPRPVQRGAGLAFALAYLGASAALSVGHSTASGRQ